MTTTIKIDECNDDDSNILRVEFTGSFDVAQSGFNVEDAIKDTMRIFEGIKNEMEDTGVFDGNDNYLVWVDEITKIIVNDIHLTDEEMDAVLSDNFTIGE